MHLFTDLVTSNLCPAFVHSRDGSGSLSDLLPVYNDPQMNHLVLYLQKIFSIRHLSIRSLSFLVELSEPQQHFNTWEINPLVTTARINPKRQIWKIPSNAFWLLRTAVVFSVWNVHGELIFKAVRCNPSQCNVNSVKRVSDPLLEGFHCTLHNSWIISHYSHDSITFFYAWFKKCKTLWNKNTIGKKILGKICT